jgi:ribonuclease T1
MRTAGEHRRGATVPLLRLLGLLATLLLVGGCAGAASPDAGTVGESGLPMVAVESLPQEAVTTLALIDAGGPFPYAQDGATFHNRERLLPDRPSGYYAEYTVATPGSPDRGARRIVAGDGGERYYTDDHYASFREVTG